MNSKQLLLFAALCLVVLRWSTPSCAQVISGDRVGTIADASGAAIPDATVTATNQEPTLRARQKPMTRAKFMILVKSMPVAQLLSPCAFEMAPGMLINPV